MGISTYHTKRPIGIIYRIHGTNIVATGRTGIAYVFKNRSYITSLGRPIIRNRAIHIIVPGIITPTGIKARGVALGLR